MPITTLEAGVPTEKLSLAAPATTFARVEAWRKAQTPPLTKSEAWRLLVERALDAEERLSADLLDRPKLRGR